MDIGDSIFDEPTQTPINEPEASVVVPGELNNNCDHVADSDYGNCHSTLSVETVEAEVVGTVDPVTSDLCLPEEINGEVNEMSRTQINTTAAEDEEEDTYANDDNGPRDSLQNADAIDSSVLCDGAKSPATVEERVVVEVGTNNVEDDPCTDRNELNRLDDCTHSGEVPNADTYTVSNDNDTAFKTSADDDFNHNNNYSEYAVAREDATSFYDDEENDSSEANELASAIPVTMDDNNDCDSAGRSATPTPSRPADLTEVGISNESDVQTNPNSLFGGAPVGSKSVFSTNIIDTNACVLQAPAGGQSSVGAFGFGSASAQTMTPMQPMGQPENTNTHNAEVKKSEATFSSTSASAFSSFGPSGAVASPNAIASVQFAAASSGTSIFAGRSTQSGNLFSAQPGSPVATSNPFGSVAAETAAKSKSSSQLFPQSGVLNAPHGTAAVLPTPTSADHSSAVAEALANAKVGFESQLDSLKAAHTAVLNANRNDLDSVRKQFEDVQLQLSNTTAKCVVLGDELASAKAKADDLLSQVEVANSNCADEKANAAQKETALGVALARVAALEAELAMSPKEKQAVEELGGYLKEWFAEYAEEAKTQSLSFLRGVGDLDDNSAEDEAAQDGNCIVPVLATRNVQRLRAFFSNRLIQFAEEAQRQARLLMEAQLAVLTHEATAAQLREALQAALNESAMIRANGESQAVTVEGQLADTLEQLALARDAGESLKNAAAATTEALSKTSADLEASELRYALLLATKESLVETLASAKAEASLAIGQARRRTESIEQGHAEEVLSLKRQITTLTELATSATASAKAAERKLLSHPPTPTSVEVQGSSVTVLGSDDGSPLRKVIRSEVAGVATKFVDAPGRCEEDGEAEQLLATGPPIFEHQGPIHHETLLAETNVDALRSHADQLGLLRVDFKRSRCGDRTLLPPTFSEAAEFYMVGKEQIEILTRDNDKLRVSLQKAVANSNKAKALEASRSQTVGAFAALHEEVDHLRADNKRVRDMLEGAQEENRVLTAQLVSTMLKALSMVSIESAASPMAPLPPSNAIQSAPFTSVFGSAAAVSPRLFPMQPPSMDFGDLSSQNIVSTIRSSLATIRQCATEAARNNSSITMNPEVQADASRRLQTVKNETLRLTKHKEALIKLIESRERRLASVTAHLVRLAAQNPGVTAFSNDNGSSVVVAEVPMSPTRALHQVVREALSSKPADVVPMSNVFGYGAALESAVALALGFADEQKTLLCMFEVDGHTNNGASHHNSDPRQRTFISTALRSVAIDVPASPPSLALDRLRPNINVVGAQSSTFVAELLERMNRLSAELEALRSVSGGEAGSEASRLNLEVTTTTASHQHPDTQAQRAIEDRDVIINSLRSEVAALRASQRALASNSQATEKKVEAVKNLVASLTRANEYALSACDTVATARKAAAEGLAKWRERALLNSSDFNTEGDTSTLSDVVKAAKESSKSLCDSLSHLVASSQTTASSQQLALTSALCQLLSRYDDVLQNALASATSNAEHAAQKMLAQRMKNFFAVGELMSETVAECEDYAMETKEEHGPSQDVVGESMDNPTIDTVDGPSTAEE